LISDLLGFYVAVRGLNPSYVEDTCGVVSEEASANVWDTWGAVSSYPNRQFKPQLYPCEECKMYPKPWNVPLVGTLPPMFQDIKPAKKGGYMFRDWELSDDPWQKRALIGFPAAAAVFNLFED